MIQRPLINAVPKPQKRGEKCGKRGEKKNGKMAT